MRLGSLIIFVEFAFVQLSEKGINWQTQLSRRYGTSQVNSTSVHISKAGENPLLNFYIPPFFENNEVFLVFRIYITAKHL